MANYVEKTLGEGETLLRAARIAWPFGVAAWASLLVLGLVIIGVVIFARLKIRIATTEFALTSRRLILKQGWLTRRTQELSLGAIEEIEIEQGFWGRMLGFGRLRISGAGTGEVLSPPIDNPVDFRAALSEARAGEQSAAAAPTAA